MTHDLKKVEESQIQIQMNQEGEFKSKDSVCEVKFETLEEYVVQIRLDCSESKYSSSISKLLNEFETMDFKHMAILCSILVAGEFPRDLCNTISVLASTKQYDQVIHVVQLFGTLSHVGTCLDYCLRIINAQMMDKLLSTLQTLVKSMEEETQKEQVLFWSANFIRHILSNILTSKNTCDYMQQSNMISHLFGFLALFRLRQISIFTLVGSLIRCCFWILSHPTNEHIKNLITKQQAIEFVLVYIKFCIAFLAITKSQLSRKDEKVVFSKRFVALEFRTHLLENQEISNLFAPPPKTLCEINVHKSGIKDISESIRFCHSALFQSEDVLSNLISSYHISIFRNMICTSIKCALRASVILCFLEKSLEFRTLTPDIFCTSTIIQTEIEKPTSSIHAFSFFYCGTEEQHAELRAASSQKWEGYHQTLQYIMNYGTHLGASHCYNLSCLSHDKGRKKPVSASHRIDFNKEWKRKYGEKYVLKLNDETGVNADVTLLLSCSACRLPRFNFFFHFN